MPYFEPVHDAGQHFAGFRRKDGYTLYFDIKLEHAFQLIDLYLKYIHESQRYSVIDTMGLILMFPIYYKWMSEAHGDQADWPIRTSEEICRYMYRRRYAAAKVMKQWYPCLYGDPTLPHVSDHELPWRDVDE